MGKYYCANCNFTCRKEHYLENHMDICVRHIEKPKSDNTHRYNCPHCGFYCEKLYHYESHLKQCAEDAIITKYYCTNCDFTCRKEYYLENHMDTCVRHIEKPKSENKHRYNCPQCGFYCEKLYHYESHLKQCAEDAIITKYYCTNCDFTCRKEYYLENHMDTCVRHIEKPKSENKHRYNCPYCDFYCEKLDHFENHSNQCIYHIENNILNTITEPTIIDLGYGSQNIAHDFHELIFHILLHFIHRPKLFLENITFRINNKMMLWTKYLINLICDDLSIKTVFTDEIIGTFPRTIGYTRNGYAPLRRIKKYRNFMNYIDYINNLALKKTGLEKRGNNYKYTVLHTRKECSNRRLLNCDAIKQHFDLVIDDMNIDIEDQIKIYQKATHIVTVSGAQLTNIIFMEKNAKVMDIYNHQMKCWATRYGTSLCINNYVPVQTNSYKIIEGMNKHKSTSLEVSDIVVDDILKDKIIEFLNT